MSPGDQSTLVMIVSLALYIVAPLPFLAHGRFICAGLAMFSAALLPLIWQGIFTDSDAPGFGLLLLFTAPIPLFIVVVGLLVAAFRAGRSIWRKRTPTDFGLQKSQRPLSTHCRH